MSDASAVKSLGELGKRIERMFYFGTLLLLLGCLDLYFVSIANYVERENLDDVRLMISSFAENFDRLDERFKNPPQPPAPSQKVGEDEKTRRLREKLGLPPAIERPDRSATLPVQTYKELLDKMVDEIRFKARLSRESLAIVQDASKSPQEIMALLESRRVQLASKPVTIWGVESPLIVPLQYGGARYQLPASFIAKSLTLALFPLFLGWLGSLYLTRHRELLIIRRLGYYGHTFPHILNIFHVAVRMDESIESSLRLRTKRKTAVDVWFQKFMPVIFRSIVLILFCAPMTLLLGYNSIQLFSSSPEVSLVVVVPLCILLTWFLLQIFMLLAQEWILLWNRTYYA
jgi:hypothetical protein